jgi:hypothetical protein
MSERIEDYFGLVEEIFGLGVGRVPRSPAAIS